MKKFFILSLIILSISATKAQLTVSNIYNTTAGTGIPNHNMAVQLSFGAINNNVSMQATVLNVANGNSYTWPAFNANAGYWWQTFYIHEYGGDNTALANYFMLDDAHMPSGTTYPANVKFIITDLSNGDTDTSDVVQVLDLPSSLELRKPLNGQKYIMGSNIACEIWNINLANNVTVEYAPWGTANYTQLAYNPSWYYPAHIPTPGNYSLRVRNLSFMDSVMVTVVDSTPPYMHITHPQDGDVLTLGLLDSVITESNSGIYPNWGYILDSNDSTIGFFNLAPGTNWDIYTADIVGRFNIVGLYPDTLLCEQCKLVINTVGMHGDSLTDTVNISVRGRILSGRVYFDLNNSGTYDAGDTPLNDPNVGVLPNNGLYNSRWDGTYRYVTGTDGQYTLTAPVITTCQNQVLPATQTVTFDSLHHVVGNIDFRIIPTGAPYDLSATMLGNTIGIVGGAPHVIQITNSGGTASPAGSVTLSFDAALEQYVASIYPAPVSQTANSITYDVPAINPCQSYTIPTVILATAPNGTIITNSIQLNGYINDGDLTNNTNTVNLTVIASYDPNDKEVDKKIIYTPELASEQKLLYTIRFQNTGNAPAYNIKVVDTLAANIDMTTFAAVASSHAYNLVRKEGNTLEFRFTNIQLADSTTFEEGSHGYVAFTVTRPDGLIAGDAIKNFADIYFDYNLPVRTNTAVTQILDPLSVKENAADVFNLYPNPAKGFVQITMKDKANGKVAVKLYSTDGKMLQSATHYMQNSTVLMQDISTLNNGVYYVGINVNGKEIVKKLVVIH